ncbi:chemotaxis protein MotB [Cyclobacterium lianum]|uniref:Chemotaxis protein MotB n=1 Tax=Cyclobacterium lianum TaxID=388280 RepID=A0A1M7HPY5_9BACT|nr:OmpA family protein [Cyclobacterium lianum]SHM30403.1 chemotaxis protein MotB [Cyclobacterium lianum]
MKKLPFIFTLVLLGGMASCVSKKKYTSLQGELYSTRAELAQTTTEKEALEAKFEQIERRVAEYNAKINSLRGDNEQLLERTGKMMTQNGDILVSEQLRKQLEQTISQIDTEKLAQAKTLEDSVNLAISHNLFSAIGGHEEGQDEDIVIDVDKTVVMISVSDRLLFNTGSFRVNQQANPLLERLSAVINSEPSLEVMVEGHTDPRSISTATVQDNWDLSVKRATSIVRKLVEEHGVAPEQLIAAGRSSFFPLVENDSPENMAKNRRTRIILIPDLDKFFAMM